MACHIGWDSGRCGCRCSYAGCRRSEVAQSGGRTKEGEGEVDGLLQAEGTKEGIPEGQARPMVNEQSSVSGRALVRLVAPPSLQRTQFLRGDIGSDAHHSPSPPSLLPLLAHAPASQSHRRTAVFCCPLLGERPWPEQRSGAAKYEGEDLLSIASKQQPRHSHTIPNPRPAHQPTNQPTNPPARDTLRLHHHHHRDLPLALGSLRTGTHLLKHHPAPDRYWASPVPRFIHRTTHSPGRHLRDSTPRPAACG